MNDVVVVLTLIAALISASAAILVARVVLTRPPPPPGEPLLPHLARLHDELTVLRRALGDIATGLTIAQESRETVLLKQNSDLHDRIMVIMSPAFLREFRRQAVTPEERSEMLRTRRQDLAAERATRRIHYPGFEPDLRPRAREGGIDEVVSEDVARRGVMAESFDDLPEDRSDVAPDSSTPEGALTAAHREFRGGRR